MKYAGIGSRRTPSDILEAMTIIASNLFLEDFTLRSGGAKGADQAFELGAGEKKEIFYANVNKRLKEANWEDAFKLVYKYHPNYKRLSEYGGWLMARNSFQILGAQLSDPVDFVICWSPSSTRNSIKALVDVAGGTGQAIRIASDYGINCYNLNDEVDYKLWVH